MRRLILILALISLPVASGEVYKCKGPNGEITFTNIKCPAHTDTEHYSNYEPEPDPPPPATVAPAEVPPTVAPVSSSAPVEQPVPPAIPVSASPQAQPSTSPVAQTPNPSEPSVAASESNPVSGYRCADGENVWLQSTPCPPAAARTASRPSEPSTQAAAPVATATAGMPTATDPQGVTSQGALCDQLLEQMASPGRRKDAAGTDELNKLLAANGCKR